MDILRFLTAGSVDDGKSTLIGRLLYDTDNILEDQLEAIERSNRKNDDGSINLAVLTDGLKSEREQGITIDVAYKYFSTAKRKFIIADTPGHIQYTRNMVTGASTANLAIILVDARKGLVEQTHRHSFIASLLGIPHVVLAINKMDLVDYDQAVFDKIANDYRHFVEQLAIHQYTFIPVSALKGDNIASRSAEMPWYDGPSLLEFLEEVPLASKGDVNLENSRFPVQWVIRPHAEQYHDYRGYAGKITSGIFRIGDKVTVEPSGIPSHIKAIEVGGQKTEVAFAPMAAVLHLEDEIDVGRGDTLVKSDGQVYVTQTLEGDICWMDNRPLNPDLKYIIQHNSKQTLCYLRDVLYKVNVNSLEKNYTDTSLGLNDIGRVVIQTAEPLVVDLYEDNRSNGSAIIIDERSNVTVGAVMIRSAE
ncbi:sulfate adenylyltransferase subunit 1 [bacterium A37T11]|nr:sulfate adenylyltransferase subunit 1 [bacterium A37T11]